jgi:hypothetical protein
VKLCLSCALDDCDEGDPECAFRQYERERVPKKRQYAKRERFVPVVGLDIQERRGGRYVWTIRAVYDDGSVKVDRVGGRCKLIKRLTDYVKVA